MRTDWPLQHMRTLLLHMISLTEMRTLLLHIHSQPQRLSHGRFHRVTVPGARLWPSAKQWSSPCASVAATASPHVSAHPPASDSARSALFQHCNSQEYELSWTSGLHPHLHISTGEAMVAPVVSASATYVRLMSQRA